MGIQPSGTRLAVIYYLADHQPSHLRGDRAWAAILRLRRVARRRTTALLEDVAARAERLPGSASPPTRQHRHRQFRGLRRRCRDRKSWEQPPSQWRSKRRTRAEPSATPAIRRTT
jgi:hypothetical protein